VKSSVRRAIAGVGVALLLTACGEGPGPGVAADVNGQQITDQEVDDFAQVLCSLGGTQGSSGGTPTSQVRSQSLQILMTIALTNDMTDVSQNVNQARVSSIEQQMNQSRSTVPAASQDTFDTVVAKFALAQSATIDLGRQALEAAGKTGPISDQDAYNAGNRLRTVYAADKADIEVDPRFGTMVNGALKAGSGSLSVPVSQGARDAEAPTPVGAHVSALPASQKCS
jgi:hypothetical protein